MVGRIATGEIEESPAPSNKVKSRLCRRRRASRKTQQGAAHGHRQEGGGWALEVI